MIPTRVSNLERARKHSGVYVDLYCDALTKGDPLADAAVLEMEKLPRGAGMKMFEQALAEGIGAVRNAPPALVALFAQVDEIPEWVDWERMALGARTYQRTGAAGGLVLSAVSLMNGYHSSAAIKPLLFTGRLDQMARRRLAETGRFIFETIQTDGLRRYARGFATTLKVRLVHAFVRRMLSQSPRWNTEAWGTPINQADMGATNLSFSVALIHGVREIGIRMSREEADALIHLWRYSGYLSGVDIGLLAVTEEEAWFRAELNDMIQPSPDEGSILLAEALRTVNRSRSDNPLQKAMAPFLLRYHDGLTRVALGDEKADNLGAPNKGWKYVVQGMRPLVTASELVRERVPFGTRLAAVVGNRMWQNALEMELGGKDADFAPPSGIPGEGRFGPSKGRPAQAA